MENDIYAMSINDKHNKVDLYRDIGYKCIVICDAIEQMSLN